MSEDLLLRHEQRLTINETMRAISRAGVSRASQHGSTASRVYSNGTYDGEGNWVNYLLCDNTGLDETHGCGP